MNDITLKQIADVCKQHEECDTCGNGNGYGYGIFPYSREDVQ